MRRMRRISMPLPFRRAIDSDFPEWMRDNLENQENSLRTDG